MSLFKPSKGGAFRYLLNSLLLAFSMYSIVPLPQTDWTKNNMRYVLCFFPLVGVLVGGLFWLLLNIVPAASFPYAAAILPLLITGGIHFDGFIDTSDALASHQPLEKRLEILRDPHVGAFGIIYSIILVLAQLGLYASFYGNFRLFVFVILGFVISRSLSSLSIMQLPIAKNSGIISIFSDTASKMPVLITSIIYLMASFVMSALVDWSAALVLLSVCAGWYLLFGVFCRRFFGGVTGDLAGFFLCISELLTLGVATWLA